MVVRLKRGPLLIAPQTKPFGVEVVPWRKRWELHVVDHAPQNMTRQVPVILQCPLSGGVDKAANDEEIPAKVRTK